jgi:hypothetical protein
MAAFIEVNPPSSMKNQFTKIWINVENILLLAAVQNKSGTQKALLYMRGDFQMPLDEDIDAILDKIKALGPPPTTIPPAFQDAFDEKWKDEI